MDDGAAREVERSEPMEPSVSRPDPMRQRVIDERSPRDREDEVDMKAQSLDERARNQRDGNPREHRLKRGERDVRDRGTVRPRRETDAGEPEPLDAAHDSARAERQ